MSVHPSICLSTPKGGYPGQVQPGSTTARSSLRGTPQGVPHLRSPLLDLARWVPPGRGTPPQVPPSHLAGGTPYWGDYPTLGTPPSDLAGGIPPTGGYPTLDTPIGPSWGYSCEGVPHLGYPRWTWP